MPVITCQNEIIESGKVRTCGRYLTDMPIESLEILKGNPEYRIYFRCPACPPAQRWLTIYHNKEGFCLRTLTSKPNGRKDDYETMKFDRVFNIKQIA